MTEPEFHDLRSHFMRFRVLIVGRANSGKSTILQAVCGTDEEPYVFDKKGREVSGLSTINLIAAFEETISSRLI